MKHCRLYFKVDTKVTETEKAMMEGPFKILLRTRFLHVNIPIVLILIMQKKSLFQQIVLFVNCYEISLTKTHFKQINDISFLPYYIAI